MSTPKRKHRPVPDDICRHVERLIDALGAEPPRYEIASAASLAIYETLLERLVKDIRGRRFRRRADRRKAVMRVVAPTFGGRRPDNSADLDAYFRP
jgi:hypothetical protein